MEIIYHPAFTAWIDDLFKWDVEIAGEVQSLIDSLERKDIELGDPESKRIASTSKDLRELRRVPATATTPYAIDPPVLGVLYGFVVKGDNTVAAVSLIGGDKTDRGDAWYPLNIAEAERRFDLLAKSNQWRAVQKRKTQ